MKAKKFPGNFLEIKSTTEKKMNPFESITPKKQKQKWECNHKKEEKNARLTFKITGNFEYCIKCTSAVNMIVKYNLTETNVLEHWNFDYKCKKDVSFLNCPLIVMFGQTTYMKVYEPNPDENPYNKYHEVMWNHLKHIAEPCNTKPLPRIEVPLDGKSPEFEIELLRVAERIKYQKKYVWFPLLCYVIWNRIYLEEKTPGGDEINFELKWKFFYLTHYFWIPVVEPPYTKWKYWASDFFMFLSRSQLVQFSSV